MLQIELGPVSPDEYIPLAVTLDRLLGYSDDDMKEATFEASVFAELFRDMLDTRYGQGLMRALAHIKAAKVCAVLYIAWLSCIRFFLLCCCYRYCCCSS